jgi:hypothetical protein
MEADLFKKDWKKVLFGAWSSWFMWAAAALTGLEVMTPLLWEHGLLDLPPYIYPAAMSVLTAGALLARTLVQKDITNG